MKRKVKKQKTGSRNGVREVEEMVSGTGIKQSSKKMLEQYGRGIMDGMHIAYAAVVERLYRAGNTREEITVFFDGLLSKEDLDGIISEKN